MVEAGGNFVEFFQQLFLVLGEVAHGRFHHHMANKDRHRAGAQRFDAFAFHAHAPAGLGFRGDAQLHFAIKRGHFHIAAQGGGGEAHGQFAMQIQAVALECFVRFYLHHHI